MLLDLGVHLVDAAVQLFGPVKSVNATLRSIATKADDDVAITLEHVAGAGLANSKYGVVSRLFAGTFVAAPGPRTRVLGDKGAFAVTNSEASPSQFAVSTGRDSHIDAALIRGNEVVPVDVGPRTEVEFYKALPAWLAGEAPAPVDPKDALRNAVILDAARASARDGKTIELNSFK
jgi:predicted dehydrogenase